MQIAAGGGSSGHFVGMNTMAAQGLAATLSSTGGRVTAAGTRIAWLLAEAGPDGGGATAPDTLRRIDSWLETARGDLRWRMAVLAADGFPGAGGMVLGWLPFGSAAEARRAGERHATAMQDALHRAVYSDGNEAEAGMEEYQRLVSAAGVYGNDPAWAGGLVNALGSDGVFNVVWFSMSEVEGDVARSQELIAPVAASLATALRADTANPAISRELLQWQNYRLGVLLTSAKPDTDFLVAAGRTRFIDAEWSEDRTDDLYGDEAAFFLEALSDDAEASHRVLTTTGPAGERGAIDLLRAVERFGYGDADRFAGVVLEQGLVDYPAAHGVSEWNTATATTADVVRYASGLGYALDDMDPGLSESLLRLLHPHLDAIAVIGMESAEVDAGSYDVHVELPDGRQSLDVPAEDLREFFGAVLHSEEAVAHVQAVLASYAQADGVQANRMPLIEPDGKVSQLRPFVADSMRIAGLAGVIGQGLDLAGHDEESRTTLLTGALKAAGSKGVGRVIGWTGPVGWIAKEGAGKGVDWAAGEFRDWVSSFEPIEGEEGVDAFLEAYDETTAASLRDRIAADPELAALPDHGQDRIIEHAVRLSGDMVRANLLEVYAELSGETAKESS